MQDIVEIIKQRLDTAGQLGIALFEDREHLGALGSIQAAQQACYPLFTTSGFRRPRRGRQGNA